MSEFVVSEFVMAWHWVVKGKDGKLKLRDGRDVPPVGEALVHEGEAQMCESGLHASRRAIDALRYIPDGATVLCRVLCEDVVDEQDDKLVCRKRTVVWLHDCEKVLHEAACRFAEQALTEAGIKDDGNDASWNAIKVKRLWLKGEATDEELAAAYAAGAAAYAARAAARAAAYAAGDAAGDAARDAAYAAYSAYSARDAECNWQEAELLKMLREVGLNE